MSFPERTTRKAPYLLFVASALLFGVACGETASDEVVGECWPIDTAVAGEGSIQIGSGLGEFSVFESGQEVFLEAGGQGGHHIRVITRIEGLEPGDPTNILSAKNPRTLLTLIDKNGDPITGASCPMRIPYEDKGEGLELLRPYSLVFPLDSDLLATYDREPITIRAEIIDSKSNFAVSEHQVIARLPEVPPTIGSSLVETHEVMAPLSY